MIITNEWLVKNMTNNGAWTRSQFEQIGVKWPPTKGWKEKVIGTEITPEAAAKFEAKLTAKQCRKDRDC